MLLSAIDNLFQAEILESLKTHEQEIYEFLGQGNKAVSAIGIAPTALPFVRPICEYLESRFSLANMLFNLTANDEKQSRLSKSQVEGYQVVIIDGRGRYYLSIKKQIQALQPFRTLTVTWDDELGIADLVLNPSWQERLITTETAAQALDIHPDTFSRLCREGKVAGAQRQNKSWLVSKTDFKQFTQNYNPTSQGGRPKTT